MQAQDIHFSQFNAAPVFLNPAMTGNLNGAYRAAVTYRNQWASVSDNPYSTVTASFDASLFGCSLNTDHVGMGVAIFNDRSGIGAYNQTTALLSLAYHKGLDADRKYMVSIGGQVGYTQKKVDIESLCFESQIQGFEFHCDPNELTYIPNQEAIDNQSFAYFDARVGGLLTASPNEKLNFYAGGAYYHITSPQENFIRVEDLPEAEINKLGARMVFHGGATVFLTPSLSLSPSGIFMQQSGASTAVFGAALGYHFNKSNNRYSNNNSANSAFYLGSWYRLNDAIVMLAGVDFRNFNLGFSYDINISDLDQATLNQGGVELSLTFKGIGGNCNRKQGPLYCPRF